MGRAALRIIQKPIGPVLLCVGLIFLLSSTPYALQNLRPLLSGDRVVDWLNGLFAGMSFEYDRQIISTRTMGAPAVAEFFLRKFAHMVLYCCLSYSLMLALHRLTSWPKAVHVIVSLTLAAGYALFDEYYQSLIPERTSSLADVGVDLIGALIGVLFYLLGTWKK
jgi:VanZ family protein